MNVSSLAERSIVIRVLLVGSWSSYLFLPPFTTVPPARVFKRKEPKQVEEKKKKEPSIVIVRPSNLATDARSLPTTYTTYVLVLLLHIHTPSSRPLFLWRRVRTKLDGRDSREKKDRTANCREKSQEMKKVKEKRLSAGLLTDWLTGWLTSLLYIYLVLYSPIRKISLSFLLVQSSSARCECVCVCLSVS